MHDITIEVFPHLRRPHFLLRMSTMRPRLLCVYCCREVRPCHRRNIIFDKTRRQAAGRSDPDVVKWFKKLLSAVRSSPTYRRSHSIAPSWVAREREWYCTFIENLKKENGF